MKKFFFSLALLFCVITQSMGEKIEVSTTLPGEGKIEHVYTMINGNNVYSNATTAPTQTAENYGLFAFYAVADVENAYYIYSSNAEKWLTYTPAASYSNGKDFIKFTTTKDEAEYFYVNNYSGDNYEIQPYTTSGTKDKYINWYQGVNANPYDGNNTLGLWKQDANADAGSRYLFTEVVTIERVYTINIPNEQTIKIGDQTYSNGDTYTVVGSIKKSDITVVAPEGQFAAVAIDDIAETINVYFATLPVQPDCELYTNAVLYPAQQEAVGVAKIEDVDGVYTLSNNVLAASFMKLGNSIYFAGSEAMNLLPGTEIFTVAFGNGDNVPASAMTLKSIELQDLEAKADAIGGAEHFNGKQLVANLARAVCGAVNGRVVDADELAVAGDADVGLDLVNADLDSLAKREQGVFGVNGAPSAVRGDVYVILR